MTKLKVKGLFKSYDNQPLLQNINFEVPEGSLFSILGSSGSGKTTILKIITGLASLDEGSIYLDGKNITGLKPEDRGIAYVFQAPLLFPHLTVKENIAFGLEIRKVKKAEIKQRVSELLTLLKIQDLENRLPFEISGGQQQRVAIARALAPNPPLILMDEPFSSLDPLLRQEMGALLKSLQKELGLTIIFVTHDLSESLILSDDIALIDKGRIVQTGPAKSVYYKPRSQEIGQLMGEGNWIEGKIHNGLFACAIGAFKADGEPEGPATLFLRPHHIELDDGQSNDEKFEIVKIQECGKESRLVLCHNNGELFVDTFKEINDKPGDCIGLKFPDNNLHYIRR
ncbi:MAG: ABC transporter ATP-binding protein [Acetobacterium sp.]